MKTLRTINELNWALGIYSNVVKFGLKSRELEKSNECLAILEEFEEYEKCHDLFEILKRKEEVDKT
jgi:hypothetical protein